MRTFLPNTPANTCGLLYGCPNWQECGLCEHNEEPDDQPEPEIEGGQVHDERFNTPANRRLALFLFVVGGPLSSLYLLLV